MIRQKAGDSPYKRLISKAGEARLEVLGGWASRAVKPVRRPGWQGSEI